MSKYSNIKLDPYGAVFDTDPHDVPDDIWTYSLNMRFNDNAAEKIGGEIEGTTTTAQATHLLFNGNHTEPLWLYFGDAIARVTNFTDDKDIEGTALSSGIKWDTALFNGFPICNNIVDTPRYWAGDFTAPDTLADLPAFEANTLCQALRPFRSFLVALNTTTSGVQAPNRVLWSTASDSGALPASWDITDPSTLAGDAYLTDDKGEILDGAQLRDMFVIYKTHSTYLMRLIGGQSVMRIDKVQVNSGLLAKNCIVEFKGRHFVVSDGDIVLFDGQNIESIADKRVKDTIFNDIDSDNFDKTYVARDDKHFEIWVCYPSTGQSYSDKAAIWNWKDNNWTFRELTNTRHIAPGVSNFAASVTWDSLAPDPFTLSATVISNGGAGYTVSDVLTLETGGTATTKAELTVTTVSGGVITGVGISEVGDYRVVGSIIDVPVTGGTGTGALFDLTFTGGASDADEIWDGRNTTWKSFSSNPTVDTLSSAVTLAINIIGDTFDIDGAAMTSKLEKVTMDLGEPDFIKVVKSVTPRITATSGTKVYIRIGTQMKPDDNITWGTEQLYTVGTDRESYFTQKGRFISIRMRTQDIGANWTCHGFYIKAAMSGKY